MKKSYLIYWLLSAAIVSGCDCTIHQYPEPVGGQPTLDVEISLQLDRQDPSLYRTVVYTPEGATSVSAPEAGGVSGSPAPVGSLEDDYDLRYRIDIYSVEEGLLSAAPCESYRTTVAVVSGCERHTAHFSLPEGQYTALVWADYVNKGTVQDLHYITSDLRQVKLSEDYTGSEDSKDAFAGRMTFTVDASAAGTSGSVAKVHVPIQRPFAKFYIIAIDLDDYVQAGGDVDLNSAFSYDFWVPSTYDVAEEKAVAWSQDCSFRAKVSLNENRELVLASDYVFATDEESSIRVNIELNHPELGAINRIPAIEIPLIRNGLTVVTGELLTDDFEDSTGSGNVGIDDGFDDEIVVVIPD